MELAALLSSFLQGLTAWLPRVVLVNVTQRAVRFRRGQEPVLLEPGFHWYLPLTTTVELTSILLDASEFKPTVLPTSDGKTVAIGFVIVWKIDPKNVIKAATTCDSPEGMIGEQGESLLPEIVAGHSNDELLARIRGDRGMKTINSKLTADASSLLGEYGLTVVSARVNFLAPTKVFRLLTDTPEVLTV